MMQMLGLIAGLAALMYAMRLAGMYLDVERLPAHLRRMLGFAPLALLAALIAPALVPAGGSVDWLLAAGLLLTGLITRRSGSPGLGMLAGVGLLGLLALV